MQKPSQCRIYLRAPKVKAHWRCTMATKQITAAPDAPKTAGYRILKQ